MLRCHRVVVSSCCCIIVLLCRRVVVVCVRLYCACVSECMICCCYCCQWWWSWSWSWWGLRTCLRVCVRSLYDWVRVGMYGHVFMHVFVEGCGAFAPIHKRGFSYEMGSIHIRRIISNYRGILSAYLFFITAKPITKS